MKVIDSAMRALGIAIAPLGYTLIKGTRPETPAQVAERFGLPPARVSLLLARCPFPFTARRGKTGRICAVTVTPELAAYLQKNKLGVKR